VESMERILDQLQVFIEMNATRAFFNPPANDAAIDGVEQAIGLSLPKSYRSFLRRFDGGFINICRFGSEDQVWNLKAARWNTNWLFGTDQLIKAYDKARSIGGWERISYIPFCQTSGQESLVFVPAADGSEPPVLDAWHEAAEWAAVYPDFPAMLLAYVDREGNIKTAASA
jgi:hypothetical protein